MAKRTVFHVTQRPDGSWAIAKEGSSRASSLHDTQAEAIAAAIKQAKAQPPGQVKVHGEDGKIREEWTYGQDPQPPKG